MSEEGDTVDYEELAEHFLIDDDTLRLHGQEWEQKQQ